MSATAAKAEQAAFASSATPLTRVIDRWIYVFMAALFIVVTLVGFIPDSLSKIAAVEAGRRPPFPLMLHAHAVLMGSFLLVLLTQTYLLATGRQARHEQLGMIGGALAAALVVVGIMLVPTMYHLGWDALQAAGPEEQSRLSQGLQRFDNIMLAQIRIGVLFPLFIGIALWARKRDSGLHKRLMFLAVALALPAAFDRMTWLPTTLPGSPLTIELYPLVALAPMFIWDLIRLRTIHRAYVIWLAIVAPTSVAMFLLWDTAWWHGIAPRIVGI